MPKRVSGYERRALEHYPTPAWTVTEGLAKHITIKGRIVAEPACGTGEMVRALKEAGAAKVFASDVDVSGYGKQMSLFGDDRLPKPTKRDFLSEDYALPPSVTLIVTNPPYGKGGVLAEEFIKRGLECMRGRMVTMCLLLPVDFDSAKSRAHLFERCREFHAQIVLRRRIKWFESASGAGPSDNHAWFVWTPSSSVLPLSAFKLYAP